MSLIEDKSERLIEISDEKWGYADLGTALKAAGEAAERAMYKSLKRTCKPVQAFG